MKFSAMLAALSWAGVLLSLAARTLGYEKAGENLMACALGACGVAVVAVVAAFIW